MTPSNGGHWFFTEIVSASPEASGGAFTGCFAGVANKCYEGIAVSQGSSPFGPYHVYFLNADYNPAEPGYPSLLNDFAKIGVTRDAFMMFYDEFPLHGRCPASAAASSTARRSSRSTRPRSSGAAGHAVKRVAEPRVQRGAREHGPAPHPGRDLRRRQRAARRGITCWVAVIPAQPAAPASSTTATAGPGS